jgi:beta-lactamase superfamily II metal-dependent hydrolase
MYIATLDAAVTERARWVGAREGTRIAIDGMEMNVVYPLRRLDAQTDANDYSAVILLRFGRFGALLLGDAPVAAEERIAERQGGALRAQVVKIGHHGSATSTGAALLRSTQARLALVSVGARNRYGHPATEVLARLRRNNVAVLRTDEQGAIVIRANATGRFRLSTER